MVMDLLTLSSNAGVVAWGMPGTYGWHIDFLGIEVKAGGEAFFWAEVLAVFIVFLLSSPHSQHVDTGAAIAKTSPNWITEVALPRRFPKTLLLPTCDSTQATSNDVLGVYCAPC